MAKRERKVIGPVELTDMAYGGEAVGRHEGMVVFVYLGAPGDIATVDVTITKKSFARGSIVDLVRPSDLRTTPPCPYFGSCGGCQWQHIRYEEQIKLKQHLVAEAFERIGHLPVEVLPTLGMDHPWHYRNTMEFGFTFEQEPGLRRLRGHRIVPIGECIISRLEINEVLGLLWDCFYREKMAEVTPHNAFVRVGDGPAPRTVVGLWGHGEWPHIADRMVQDRPDLIAGVVQRKGRSSEKGRILFGRDYTEHELLGKRYRASLASFFQVNHTQTEVLIRTALAFLQPEPDQVVLDAYSGVGTFSLQLADRVAKVVAVEASPSANVDARMNTAGLDNVSLVEGNFGEVTLPVERVDGVVIDPPRGGVAPEGLDALVRLSPERIVYVSCDPTTLARDAALLVGAGYRLERVQPIDLFPQTYHVETVALFLR
ncbi:MAG: 23S rRNA (uracil(1939)-C(5))-methyltransferase RlmD [Sphingomonadaceae bacterium]